MMEDSVRHSLFRSVAAGDYESLATLYAAEARNSVVSYCMWSAEEKRDESFGPSSGSSSESFSVLLRELALFIGEASPDRRKKLEISAEAEDVLRDATATLSATRPPSNFVVYDQQPQSEDSDHTDQQPEGPPAFDGAVANATPPPLGGTVAAGGAGTLLHLACALDLPLALAFLLAMGADARSCHTAFRRLMIHEAACNGSIGCLTLLLEQGRKYGEPDTSGANSRVSVHLPFLPRRLDNTQVMAPMQLFAVQPDVIAPKERRLIPKRHTMELLYLFREVTYQVRIGSISELDAAREIMNEAGLDLTTKQSLAKSCGFTQERSFLRGGVSDGHGNTPLHWAAFKNETECVALLLEYNADANARAHPSGWTPLHDAAYSNSKDTIELLVNAGARVDARANSGATPLCFAAQEDAAGAAELLLKRGADLSARCAGGPVRDDGTVSAHSRFSGYTPLHYCAHYNASSAARVLLKHSSAKRAMEIPDLSERLPIHVSVARGSSDVLRELLHAGVQIQTRYERESEEAGQSAAQNEDAAISMNISDSDRDNNVNNNRNDREAPATPERSSDMSTTPVSSPLLRSMIPSQPITSSKPWNCLTQRSIDECRALISEAEKPWSVHRNELFTPADRRAVVEVLRVGKHLELSGSGVFLDLWPTVLNFCGRGWFDREEEEDFDPIMSLRAADEDGLSLPML